MSSLASPRGSRRSRGFLEDRSAAALALLALLAIALLAAGSASAATGPGWTIRSIASPTNFTPGKTPECAGNSNECDGYFITATNVGTEPSSGHVVINDALPAGTAVVRVPEKDSRAYEPNNQNGLGTEVACSRTTRTVSCTDESPVPPAGVITIHIEVEVTDPAGSLLPNHAEVSEVGGAGAPPAASERSMATPVSSEPPRFGVQAFSLDAFGSRGEPDVQAGSHPSTITTTIAYNSHLDLQGESESLPYSAVAEPKIENVELPMGFVGDMLSAPRCTAAALADESCPPDTRVGVVGLYEAAGTNDDFPNLYNVVPEDGYPAQFGLAFIKTVIMLRPRLLPSKDGYVLSVPVPGVPRSENVKLHEVTVTFFGDPSLQDGVGTGEAFATNPQDCGSGPLSATLEMNAWVEPQDWQTAQSTMFETSPTQGVSGCGALQFQPTIQVTPEATTTDTPSGYEVDVSVPQTPNFEGNLATPDIKNASLTLPEGVSVSPSAANGLVACQPSGPEGIELGNNDSVEADRLASEGIIQEGEELGYQGNGDGLVHAARGHCPAASQIGDVEVITPLLAEPLTGHAYVAAPACGNTGQPACTPHSAEDGELFGIYFEISGSGVIVKVKGNVSVNPSTGQLTTTFKEAPQLPFSELRLKLNGGQRAPLANPQTCGQFTATSDITPWSTPYTPDARPSSPFAIGGCTGAFAPAFAAGMSSTLQAGAYSPFTLTFSRHDGEQDLSGLTVNMPQGLLGKIAGIAQCGQAEVAAAIANAGGCPTTSKVGTATAAAGAGSTPFWQSGPVYLTGPYNGAPFGLAVVVPANAGPYHLGNIVVRAAIHIDPATAAVTVVSDALPQMIDGVPLRVKTVNVTVGNETPFTFNPTDCSAKSVAATVSSAQGTSVPVSSPFAAAGCRNLPFHPSFTVSTQGKVSKQNGASLDVRISTHQGPDQKSGEEEANIHKVNVQLPIALPSRLTTLQKACTEKQFATNPAGCPEASFVGTAVAHTPLLPVPLEGPAILVSHGGAAFPNLEIILQGDGVVVQLSGNTDIKHGITYSRFETAPDAPFSSFELKLPEGPHSVLGSFIAGEGTSFCGLTKIVTSTKTVTRRVKGHNRRVKVKVKKTVAASLEMPTTITAQNGAVMTQNTKVAVTGCPKAAAAKKASTAHKARNARRKRR